MKMVFIVPLLILHLCISIQAEFKPAAKCMDIYGNLVSSPESEPGFLTGIGSMVVQTMAPIGTYSSSYSSQAYTTTEETVANLNEIGNKNGVHWLARPLIRQIKSVTIPSVMIKSYIIKTKWFEFEFPKIETREVQSSTNITANISIEWAFRNTIASINTFDLKTGADGIEDLGCLSDNPSLRKILNICPAGVEYKSMNCVASAYVLMGKGDNDPWNKVLIVADGHDPRCKIGIQEIMHDIPNSLTPFASEFMRMANANGYDVVFVDFKDGGDDIVQNARILLKVIEEVCARAGSEVTVGGYSMGGLTARVALLLGQKNSVAGLGKVKRFLSIDSPHLGAQVNYDMQAKLLDIADANIWEPADYLYREAVYSLAFDLKSKAARQMCFTHALANEHDRFYEFVKNLGNYPSNMKKIAVADACWKWPYPGVSLNGAPAAIINGSTLYMRNEDFFPGAYIDLWASSKDLHIEGAFIAALTGLPGAFRESVGFDTYKPASSLYGDTFYRPTHMPLYSAFGIEKSTFLTIPEPQNQVDLDRIAKQYSGFDKLYMVDFTSRYRHIQFNEQLANVILSGIKKPDIMPILQLLLSD